MCLLLERERCRGHSAHSTVTIVVLVDDSGPKLVIQLALRLRLRVPPELKPQSITSRLHSRRRLLLSHETALPLQHLAPIARAPIHAALHQLQPLPVDQAALIIWKHLLGQALGVELVLLLAVRGLDANGGTGIVPAATLPVHGDARVIGIVLALAVPRVEMLAYEACVTHGGAGVVLATALLPHFDTLHGHCWCCTGTLDKSARAYT